MVVCTSVLTEDITIWARRLRRSSASSEAIVFVTRTSFLAQDRPHRSEILRRIHLHHSTLQEKMQQ
jgi:hypothetical protein